MVEFDVLLINSQQLVAIIFVLYHLVRGDSFLEEIGVDCYKILLSVEGKDVSTIIKAVGDLRNLDVFELTC